MKAIRKTAAKPPGSGNRRIRPRRSARPVSSVAAGARRPHLKLKNILVPVDFSGESAKALRYALPLARFHGAKITLLHVVTPHCCAVDSGYGPVNREIPDSARMSRTRDRLEVFARTHLDRHLPAGLIVRHGAPFDEITRAARQLDSDLIIMSTRGCANLEPGELDSTSERVVRHAPCPVMVVRPREHEFV
ncbi:MAG TPA: universal stress protein [Candidatus Angelobacter sp.]|nr:universal stress protein [Candidatus Angelobacter sp.]